MTQHNRSGYRFHMLSLVCALLLSAPLHAAPEVMSRDQAAQHVQRQHGGRILDLQPVTTGNGQAYRVKLLQPSGRVKLMLIDARDGKPRPFSKPATKKSKGKSKGKGKGAN